ARSANGNYLFSTMTPSRASYGLIGMTGNLCDGAIARVGVADAAEFDRTLYLAIYYLGAHELQADGATIESLLEPLRRKVTRDDLYHTWLLNWGEGSADGLAEQMAGWSKNALWEYLVRN